MGASVAVSSAGTVLFSAVTMAVEVMVAPESASTSLSSSRGSFLPMNCLRKSSSSMVRWPKPGVSPSASILMEVMALSSSMVAVTVTSLWKPCAAPEMGVPSATGASVAAGSSVAAGAAALFTASSTAVEVMVAPESASTPSTGRVLPMN